MHPYRQQKRDLIAPGEPRALGACVLAAALSLSRHPAAVLTSLRAPCSFADLDGVLARVLRSPRADCRAGSPARRAAESRAARASGTAAHARRPGPSYPRYLQPGPEGPASVAAGGGSPVTSEGSWPFRCFGHHVDPGGLFATRRLTFSCAAVWRAMIWACGRFFPSSRPQNRVCRVRAACLLARAGSADHGRDRGEVHG